MKEIETMKTYKATINGRSFMTTWGKNKAEAREKAEEMLNRLGRRGYFIRWKAAGSVVVEK